MIQGDIFPGDHLQKVSIDFRGETGISEQV